MTLVIPTYDWLLRGEQKCRAHQEDKCQEGKITV